MVKKFVVQILQQILLNKTCKSYVEINLKIFVLSSRPSAYVNVKFIGKMTSAKLYNFAFNILSTRPEPTKPSSYLQSHSLEYVSLV